MNQEIRNKLRNVVTKCRTLLEKSLAEDLEGKFRIYSRNDVVTADPNAPTSHLTTDEEKAARKDILDHFEHIKARGFKPKDALDQLIREIAFTHLNRFCAYKMMEAREVYVGGQKFREAVSRGFNSNGVKFYLADHPEDERLFSTGHQDIAYRHFLDWLGGQLSEEIGVLFNPSDPANRLYPRQSTLDEVLSLLNTGGIKPEETELAGQWPSIWSSDETIGWVYQYFTPKELRDQSRKESPAPRNSYELAFRNQFFTPRYVVEFLTDNSLGRIWYEMRNGDTKLKDQCKFLVRRRHEFFLREGEKPPVEQTPKAEALSHEEMLDLPLHILHRPKKDPRDLKIIDPACGSGHFLLYCFDLLQTIYEEAFLDSDLRAVLQQDYASLDDLKRDIPRLILSHNLHGIDIDLRASQIAALALWLRCQRAFQEVGMKKDRPKIVRSNFVCAEPMPGEQQMLGELCGQLEPKLLGQIVKTVFEKMRIAGEAGSLLRIEEEIRGAVAEAKKQWIRETERATDRHGQPLLFTKLTLDQAVGKAEQNSLFDLSDITDAQFFEEAEAKVIEALRQFAQKAHNGRRLARRLFTEDAERGFAFIDLCQKRYDVLLMNPPFGESSEKFSLDEHYPKTSGNLLEAFVERSRLLTWPTGVIGSVIDATVLIKSSYESFRKRIAISRRELRACVWLGWDVLDTANVEAGALILTTGRSHPYFDSLNAKNEPEQFLRQYVENPIPLLEEGRLVPATAKLVTSIPNSSFPISGDVDVHVNTKKLSEVLGVAKQGVAPVDSFRVMRLRCEIPNQTIGIDKRWRTVNRGGAYCPFYRDYRDVLNWENDGQELKEEILRRYPYLNGNVGWVAKNEEYYGKPGLGYGKRTDFFSCQVLPSETVITVEGFGLYPKQDRWLTLGFLNSRIIAHILNSICGQHKYSGYVDNLPVPDLTDTDRDQLRSAAQEGFSAVRTLETRSVLSPFFRVPYLKTTSILDVLSGWKRETKNCADSLTRTLERIDAIVSKHWPSISPSVLRRYEPDSDSDGVGRLFEIAFGFLFGRWDMRQCFEPSRPDEVDPFAALPICPPGMLQGSDGFPVTETPPRYPIRINWDGVVVDDPEHKDDVVTRIRQVVELIWTANADQCETEATQLLGAKDLREFFRKTSKGGFWDQHVNRYSKSRRKAPIYWLLQSPQRNYALWFYYHRLDKDTLFKLLVNYVEPKIRLEANRLESYRKQASGFGQSNKEAKRLSKEMERQEDLVSDLQEFEEKLRRAANLSLVPDLSDGVVLNIAPIHELVPWKEAKSYWEELLEGKYEWSSIGKQLRQKGLVR